MSSKLLGIMLIIIGILTFHLLGSQSETKTLWYRDITDKIYSDPVSVGDHIVFVAGDKGNRKFKLYEIDNSGNTTAQSAELPSRPYMPLSFDNIVVVGDLAKMIRGFSVPGLKLLWESATPEQFRIPPIKTGNNLLIQGEASVLFCLDSKNGQPIWDHTFTDTLVNYASDKVIVCLHGYSDIKNTSWKATALDPESGDVLWTMTLPLGADTPLFTQNVCVLTSNEGEAMVVDQFSGNILYKHQIKGLRTAQVLDEYLIMLAAGGSRLVCMSLMDGSSWTTTMQSTLAGVAKSGNRLLIADKKNVRCLEIANGAIVWMRSLEDVYNAFPFRNGIFITHKDSFLSRTTYGSYIETGSPNSLWVAFDKSNFMKPLTIENGELLITYDGSIRLLPRVRSSQTPVNLELPGQKTPGEPNFWKDKNASEATKLPVPSPAVKKKVIESEDEIDEEDDEKPATSDMLKPAVDDWSKKD
ncbi:MAG: PQQ-binding-like beta-propeller repeat protein [Candidatus Riflebacteria bacterium]|nr:PQQ-binding-like beta-propeller repeat protein [Candidatus Riflebacteria bacterium]